MVSERSALVSFPDPASKDKIKQTTTKAAFRKQPSKADDCVEDCRGCVCVLYSRGSNPCGPPPRFIVFHLITCFKTQY